ncbi:spermidine export protein MdtI [Pectinatus haikarae]|uniref:Spermidine export protein MdtI n=2 Tax=Pectinatus haikarae TaxID=349096 RepID=A0ABT9Y9X7_9FIRM|nr:spermidine export protein MdtI [Pectinatus haikarae]
MDIAANILLKNSAGFKRKLYGFFAVICIFTAFFLLAQAVKTMDISIAYALWGAAGMLITGILDVMFYHVKLKSSALLGLLCMIIGIVIIQTMD